jgi:hypothetical protein
MKNWRRKKADTRKTSFQTYTVRERTKKREQKERRRGTV